MWCDFFGGRDGTCIFFYQIFNSLNTNSFSLGRVEESVFMTRYRNNILTNFQVLFQSFFYLISKVYNHFISTFSGDFNSIIFEINIFNVKSHTFRYTYSCAEQESNNSKIAFFCFFVINTFLTGKLIATMFYIIQ